MTKQTILIVDDDKDIVNLVSAFLRGGGYDIAAAFDAMQGFSAANRIAPALILLDVNMPAGGGFQVLDRLARSSKTSVIPVVVMTASTERGLNRMLQAKGVREVLTKPLDGTTLLQAVRRILEEPNAA